MVTGINKGNPGTGKSDNYESDLQTYNEIIYAGWLKAGELRQKQSQDINRIVDTIKTQRPKRKLLLFLWLGVPAFITLGIGLILSGLLFAMNLVAVILPFLLPSLLLCCLSVYAILALGCILIKNIARPEGVMREQVDFLSAEDKKYLRYCRKQFQIHALAATGLLLANILMLLTFSALIFAAFFGGLPYTALMLAVQIILTILSVMFVALCVLGFMSLAKVRPEGEMMLHCNYIEARCQKSAASCLSAAEASEIQEREIEQDVPLLKELRDICCRLDSAYKIEELLLRRCGPETYCREADMFGLYFIVRALLSQTIQQKAICYGSRYYLRYGAYFGRREEPPSERKLSYNFIINEETVGLLRHDCESVMRFLADMAGMELSAMNETPFSGIFVRSVAEQILANNMESNFSQSMIHNYKFFNDQSEVLKDSVVYENIIAQLRRKKLNEDADNKDAIAVSELSEQEVLSNNPFSCSQKRARYHNLCVSYLYSMAQNIEIYYIPAIRIWRETGMLNLLCGKKVDAALAGMVSCNFEMFANQFIDPDALNDKFNNELYRSIFNQNVSDHLICFDKLRDSISYAVSDSGLQSVDLSNVSCRSALTIHVKYWHGLVLRDAILNFINLLTLPQSFFPHYIACPFFQLLQHSLNGSDDDLCADSLCSKTFNDLCNTSISFNQALRITYEVAEKLQNVLLNNDVFDFSYRTVACDRLFEVGSYLRQKNLSANDGDALIRVDGGIIPEGEIYDIDSYFSRYAFDDNHIIKDKPVRVRVTDLRNIAVAYTADIFWVLSGLVELKKFTIHNFNKRLTEGADSLSRHFAVLKNTQDSTQCIVKSIQDRINTCKQKIITSFDVMYQKMLTIMPTYLRSLTEQDKPEAEATDCEDDLIHRVWFAKIWELLRPSAVVDYMLLNLREFDYITPIVCGDDLTEQNLKTDKQSWQKLMFRDPDKNFTVDFFRMHSDLIKLREFLFDANMFAAKSALWIDECARLLNDCAQHQDPLQVANKVQSFLADVDGIAALTLQDNCIL